MNNWEISKTMRLFPSTRNRFVGVYPADKVPENFLPFTLPCCFIANTDPSWKPGTHWVAAFVDKNGNVEYFDSYGRRPVNPRIRTFCGRAYRYNPYMIQPLFSVSCAQFCIFYLVQRCKGISFQSVIKMFDINNLEYNEILVKNFVKPPYVKNVNCRNKQICKSRK